MEEWQRNLDISPRTMPNAGLDLPLNGFAMALVALILCRFMLLLLG
jgi:hypothetical protein